VSAEPAAEVVIYGAGGLGREALEIVRAMRDSGHAIECIGFLVDAGYAASSVHGVPVFDNWGGIHRTERLKVVVAIGDGASRSRISREVETELGPNCFATLIHPQAVVGRTVILGTGAIIFPATSLTSDVRLGRHVVVNPGCTIAHDCQLEDFVTLSPSVALAGGVTVGEGCMLGTGASVIPQMRLGAWSVIAAGACVVHPVPDRSTVAGVPARVLESKRPPR